MTARYDKKHLSFPQNASVIDHKDLISASPVCNRSKHTQKSWFISTSWIPRFNPKSTILGRCYLNPFKKSTNYEKDPIWPAKLTKPSKKKSHTKSFKITETPSQRGQLRCARAKLIYVTIINFVTLQQETPPTPAAEGWACFIATPFADLRVASWTWRGVERFEGLIFAGRRCELSLGLSF